MSETQPRLLRSRKAAEYLGISDSTLAKWRVYGTGPQFAKLGKVVVYAEADLDRFAAERKRGSTSE